MIGMVLAYNQEDLVCDAISSLLSQSEPLDHIVVSDDASTDSTFDRISSTFKNEIDLGLITLNRNSENLGFIKHFNLVVTSYVDDGCLVFYNAGDDTSRQDRVCEFLKDYVLAGSPRHFLGHSFVEVEKESGAEVLVPPILSIEQHREIQLIASAYHIGASQVFTGALYKDFGSIVFEDCYEDLVLGYRALLKNAYRFIPLPLVKYRLGGLSGWKKNSLERKRSRFKSTLLQRVIDSIQAGDFSALDILTSCYVQYGFDGIEHPEKADVIAVSGDSASSYSYSLSNNFSRISNVVRVRCVTPHELKSEIKCDASRNEILWLRRDCHSQDFLAQLLRIEPGVYRMPVVIDLGIGPYSIYEDPAAREAVFLEYSMRSFERANIHCSCPDLAGLMVKRYGDSRVSYLHPLQDIDGEDPQPASPIKPKIRGLAIAVSSGIDCFEQLELAHRSLSNSWYPDRRIGVDKVCLEQGFWRAYDVDTGSVTSQPWNPESIEEYDFVVLICDGNFRDAGAINFLWSIAAKFTIPVFISGVRASGYFFSHGKTALFVDNNSKKWRVALELVQSAGDGLREIGKQARELLYFEASIQKKSAVVTQYLGKILGKEIFFDKFLPL